MFLGTSNTNGIKWEKLSQYVEIAKSTAFTLDLAAEQISVNQPKPDVNWLHALSNDIKHYTPQSAGKANIKWGRLKPSSLANNSKKRLRNS